MKGSLSLISYRITREQSPCHPGVRYSTTAIPAGEMDAPPWLYNVQEHLTRNLVSDDNQTGKILPVLPDNQPVSGYGRNKPDEVMV
jgi:hypothetical protein